MAKSLSMCDGIRPSLSAVIPTFNHAHHLPRALEALLSQDRPPDEIIVVDDGSTDNTSAVLASFAQEAAAVRILRNEINQGVIPSLSRGLEIARGDYVYFGAADDCVLPGFFSAAIRALQKNDAASLFCGEALLVDGKSERICGVRPAVRPIFREGVVSARAVRGLLKRSDNWILTGCAVYRRQDVLMAGGFEPTLGTFADGYLARKIALIGGFYFVPRPVAKWFIYSDGASRTVARDSVLARELLAQVLERLSLDPVFPKWYMQAFARRWRFSVARLALQEQPSKACLFLGMGNPTKVDRLVLGSICNLPSFWLELLGQLWLWLRLHPYPLWRLLLTSMTRRRWSFRKSATSLHWI